jgi:hypothetical protein
MRTAQRVRVLAEELNKMADEATGHDVSRLVWLARQLREYIDRWMGFARAPEITVVATLQSDLFAVVLACTQVLTENIERIQATPALHKAWQEFRNALQWIERTSDVDELAVITSTFENFLSTMNTVGIEREVE